MKQQEINELNIDKLIWGIFIFFSILNIYGDELEIDYIVSNKFNTPYGPLVLLELFVLDHAV